MRRTRRTFLATTGAVLLAGCGGRGAPGGSTQDDGTGAGATPPPDATPTAGTDGGTAPSEAATPERTEPTLLLNWRINGLHAPYVAARARGFYREAGFDRVAIQGGEGSDFAAQQAALGNTEFAVSSSDQLLGVTAAGLSPLAVGVVMQRNPAVIFTARERFGAELTDAEQLSGARIGSGPGMVDQMTRAYLETHGLAATTEHVDTGFDTVQQLLTGEIDAAGGVFSDIIDARNQGYRIDTLSIHESIPSYGHTITVGESFAADNPATVRAFLRATARGAAWAARNPAGAIDALVEARPELGEVRKNQRGKWDRMRSEYLLSATVRERGWGFSAPDPWERTHETLADGGFFENPVDPAAVWTNAYLDGEGEYVGGFAERVTG
jgi:NitT/TauT family transport system substrate-binding protein